MKINTRELSPEMNYRLLTGIIVPRPIAWVTTLSENGGVNLAPFSAFTFISDTPPMVGISIARKGGSLKDTARNIERVGNFVVHIADADALEAVHHSAIEYPADVSEVERLGLATVPSDLISTPRLRDAPISLECELRDIVSFGQGGSRFFAGEVLAVHVRDGLYQNGKIETAALNPICRLAGANYATLGEITRLAPVAQLTE